jgi:hypothetical protein
MRFVVCAKRLLEPAITWPRLRVTGDQGPDQVCGSGFMARVLKMNVEVWWDLSHAAHNDVHNGIAYCGLYGHLVLSLIRLNIVNGPWAEDMWYKAIINVLDQILNREGSTWRDQELFKEFLAEMLEEEGGSDLKQYPDGPDRLWERLKSDHPFRRKGAKVVLNRFMEVVRKLREHQRTWAQRIFFSCSLLLRWAS